MKRTVLILLSLLSSNLVVFTQIDSDELYSDDKWNSLLEIVSMSSSTIYYAKTKTTIYQDPLVGNEANVAIVGEVPAGAGVIVNMSGFNMWHIDYKSKKGWVKASNLTRNKPTTISSKTNKNYTSNYKISNHDVGFSPFIGQTSLNVNFRTGPSTANPIIKTLDEGTQIFVFSNSTVDNYYKAIDIMTSEIGWIHKDYVNYVQDADINESGAFQSTGYSSEYNSEVKIINKSSYSIKLIVGDETFSLEPYSTKTVNITPGKKYYIATAPSVIPASGNQEFGSHTSYEWTFWVGTSRF